MWPIMMAILRRNAVYITLPIAAVVGFVGYNLENMLSDKYTPYNKSVQEDRTERLTDEVHLKNADHVEKLRLKENVLETKDDKEKPPTINNKINSKDKIVELPPVVL